MRSAIELFEELNAVDESSRIEAKRASELGKSVMQTVIAFANEPGLDGGYLLLGANWKTNDKGDVVYWAEGLSDLDKVQKDLATQCANMLNVVVRPEMQIETVDGKLVLVVYVPESDVSQKPIYIKATGLPRGAYRRIGSTDQHCVDEDLWVLRGDPQPQTGPDMVVIREANRDDIDPLAVAEYRRLRAEANPEAEELAYGDDDLLEAICALKRADGELCPTLAGIVLFGKSLALRRLMPALRIDYIRVPGMQWVEDPDDRFVTTLDLRKPLMLALRQMQNTILDELPKGFRLDDGEMQSRQEPLLPRKVIREALANAAMHRSYQIHSPVQIIRYSNRIEVINPGFSLKDMADLGKPGSRLRNPAIAAVLHDLHWAETKGSGIRTMRRLSADAGLPLPEFNSDRQKNEFKATLFLHHLLTEDDYRWLKSLAGDTLNAEEAKVLIYARETGAVDNTACRDFSGLDTLTASQVLRRLRDRGLLVKQGSGSRTYYTLQSPVVEPDLHPEQTRLPFENEPVLVKGGKLNVEGGKLNRADLPPELATCLPQPGQRLSAEALRALICELCRWQALRGEELATLLDKDLKYLRNKHLTDMVQSGQLTLLYPESPNHPHQAYVASAQDKEENEPGE
ncbi:ATP-binding protein [Methylomonas sp. MS20]|uniref:ATP-binding protein n=1 Tax=unclassified Methylomonas TaxID=2608980 RepID=UPI0028A4F91E|nr:ATP-binding protein [Methylomonas sp. MV1]MDT4330724.1 ATP-binding protein [Methylomonas sp. MV1]MDT4332747.1 ATP-binding protein [Methylomonas sp. MV1]